MLVDEKLWFMFDCMPSEQGTPSDNDYITYCGLAILNWDEKFSSWKQYKSCSKTERKQQAKEICEALRKEELVILPLIGFCKGNIAKLNGEQLSKELYGIKEFDSTKKYEFFVDEFTLNKDRALMYANYAAMISFLAWRAGQFAKLYDIQKVGFSLDLLPGDHRNDGHHPGLEAMKSYVDSSSLLHSMWHDAKLEHNLTDISFGYIDRDETPGDILSDWFAQSFHAGINPETFCMNIKRKREERRREISEVAFTWIEVLKKTKKMNYFKPFNMPKVTDFSGSVLSKKTNE